MGISLMDRLLCLVCFLCWFVSWVDVCEESIKKPDLFITSYGLWWLGWLCLLGVHRGGCNYWVVSLGLCFEGVLGCRNNSWHEDFLFHLAGCGKQEIVSIFFRLGCVCFLLGNHCVWFWVVRFVLLLGWFGLGRVWFVVYFCCLGFEVLRWIDSP